VYFNLGNSILKKTFFSTSVESVDIAVWSIHHYHQIKNLSLKSDKETSALYNLNATIKCILKTKKTNCQRFFSACFWVRWGILANPKKALSLPVAKRYVI